MRWLSWVGTSLFFLDAVLTILISSISAADVLMLLFPEFAPYRILIAEFFAFFIMSVLVAVGPKRAARPKWKVINTALTLAALFLIGTGVLQLAAAKSWKIPSTEGYSTLLIEYEIVAAQAFGRGVDSTQITVSAEDLSEAERIYESRQFQQRQEALLDNGDEARRRRAR